MKKVKKRPTGPRLDAPFSPPDWPAARPPVMVKVSKITPHPENPRTHPDAQLEGLAAAYDEFGVVIPPILDENHRLIAGEGRWLAAKKKGIEELPCIIVTGWSESKKRRFMVADNRLPMLAQFDQTLYQAVLQRIDTEGLPLRSIGFDDAALAAALQAGNGLLTSPATEWTGMPEFDQQDKTAFRSIVVHFKDQAALDKFAKATKKKITDNTRYIWYPEIKIETYADKKYAVAR